MEKIEKQIQPEDQLEKRRQKMISAPLLPLLIKTSIPTMVGMMVAMIYNLTDTFWVGQLDNTAMTAAVGIVFSFFSLIQALGFWFGYGSGNTMSRCLGAGQKEEAKIISSTGITLAAVSGLLIMLISFISIRPLALILGGNASENLMNYTLDYLRIIILVIPFSLYSTTIYNQFRLCGNVKDGMTGLMVGMVSNIFLDPVFVLLLKMGVAGAGIATLIGQVLSSAILTKLSFEHGNIRVSFKKFSLKNKRWYHICLGGAPNFCRQGITSFASVILNNLAAPYGDGIIAALTIAGRLTMIGYSLMIGFGQGFQPICAMNYGAKKYDRVVKSLKLTVSIGTVVMVISTVIMFLEATNLVSIFSSKEDVLQAGKIILRYQCISFPFIAVYAISSMFMQNIGMYGRALLISVSRQGIFYIPVIFALSAVLGLQGIYLAQPVADLLATVFSILIIIKPYRDLKDFFFC